MVIALGFSGAIIAEVYQGQMRAEKDLAIDTTCQTLPLVEFCESAHWGPKNRGRIARNIYTINMAFGTWVEVDGKKGHLEEIYLRQRYAESLLKGKLTLKLDGRTFDRNSLPKLTNKDLRKVETTHDGNDLTINLVTKEMKVPVEVIGNLPRAMTILLPGKGDVGLTYYKAKEGNWMNCSCTSWGTDGNDFGLPQEFERVKKVIGFKAYIYASREAGQADIDRAKRLLEKVGIGDVTVKTNFPIAFATIMEHIGDMCAIQSTVGKNFIKDPGLHRTLSGDGLATLLAAIFGAPANTTYGENTGVLNLTRVFDPRVIRMAAVLAILLSFCPKFACLIGLMPAATIGGVSLILYGMISAVGVRNLVESAVDFSSPRNVFVAALILVIAIGVKYGANDDVAIGAVHISGLALSALVGIILNAILPGGFGKTLKIYPDKGDKDEFTDEDR